MAATADEEEEMRATSCPILEKNIETEEGILESTAAAQGILRQFIETYPWDWEYFSLIKEFFTFAVEVISKTKMSPEISKYITHFREVLGKTDKNLESFLSSGILYLFYSAFSEKVNEMLKTSNTRIIMVEGKLKTMKTGTKRQIDDHREVRAKIKPGSSNADKDTEMEIGRDSTQTQNSKTPTTRKPKTPAQEKSTAPFKLYFEIDANLNNNLKSMHQLCPNIDTFHISDKIRIDIYDQSDFHTLQTFMKQNKIPARSLDSRATKPVKVVLRGLPKETPIQDIVDAFIENEIEPLHITLLRNRRTKLPMPLFLCTLIKTDKIDNLTKITKINYLRIRFEPYELKTVAQCYRCQGYGHSSVHCNLTPRCVKCAGPHGPRDCSIQPDNFKCANCGGGHTANYKGCPLHPGNRHLRIRRPRITNNGKRVDDFIPAPPPTRPAWKQVEVTTVQPEASTSEERMEPPSSTEQEQTKTTRQRPEQKKSTEKKVQRPKRTETSSETEKTQGGGENTRIEKKNKQEKESAFSGINELFKTIVEFTKVCNVADIVKLLKEISKIMKGAEDQMTKLFLVMQCISEYFTTDEEEDG